MDAASEWLRYWRVPAATRAFNSSVQFWIRWMCVTGDGGVLSVDCLT